MQDMRSWAWKTPNIWGINFDYEMSRVTHTTRLTWKTHNLYRINTPYWKPLLGTFSVDHKQIQIYEQWMRCFQRPRSARACKNSNIWRINTSYSKPGVGLKVTSGWTLRAKSYFRSWKLSKHTKHRCVLRVFKSKYIVKLGMRSTCIIW